MSAPSTAIGSSGTLVGAALETVGYYYQALILDGLSSPLGSGVSLFESVAALVYIAAAIVAIASIALKGEFKSGIMLLIGPGMFWAVLFPRVETSGANWIFAGEPRNQEMRDNIIKDTLAVETLPKPRVSSFFSSWVAFVDKSQRGILKTLNNGRYQSDLRFVSRMQLVSMMQDADAGDPAFKEFLHTALLDKCQQAYTDAEIFVDLTLPAAERAAAGERLMHLSGVQLNAVPAEYVATIAVDYPEIYQRMSIGKRQRMLRSRNNGITLTPAQAEEAGYWAGFRASWFFAMFTDNSDYDTLFKNPVRRDPGQEAPNISRVLINEDATELVAYIRRQEEAKKNLTADAIYAADCSTNPSARNCQIEQQTTEVERQRFECEEIWGLAFVGLIRQSMTLVDSTLQKSESVGIDVDAILNDLVTATGFRVKLDPRQPDVEPEFSESVYQENIMQEAEKRILLYRAIAKHLFRNTVADAPYGILASFAKRGRDVFNIIEKGEHSTSTVERYRALNRNWTEKTRLMHTAAAMPYYQGVILYVLGLTYPFFAFLLLIPGRHGGFLLWFALWFWVKTWDIGFAIIMFLDQVFFSLFAEGFTGIHVAQGTDPGLSPDLGIALAGMKAVDPTFQLSTYYGIIALALNSVPVITSYLILGSARAGSELISEGVKRYGDNFASGAFKFTSQFGVLGYRHATLDRRLDDVNAYGLGNSGTIGFNRAGLNRVAMSTNGSFIDRATATLPIPQNWAAMGKSTAQGLATVGAAAQGSARALQSGIETYGRFTGMLSAVKQQVGASPAEYRGMRSNIARRESNAALMEGISNAMETLGTTTKDLMLGGLRDRRTLELAWAGMDSMTSQESIRDLAFSRVYDVFELPFADQEVDPNRVEFDAYLKQKSREATAIQSLLVAGSQVFNGISASREIMGKERAWQAADLQARESRSATITQRYDARMDSVQGRHDAQYASAEQRIEARRREMLNRQDAEIREAGMLDGHREVGRLRAEHQRELNQFDRNASRQLGRLDDQLADRTGKLGSQRDIELRNSELYPHQLQSKLGSEAEKLTSSGGGTFARDIVRDRVNETGGLLGTNTSPDRLRSITNTFEKANAGLGRVDPNRGYQMLSEITRRDDTDKMRRRTLKGSVNAEEQVTRLGVVLPLSGTYASLGNSIRNGMTYAFEGLEKGIKDKLAFTFLDDHSSPKQAEKHSRALLEMEKLRYVISASSGNSLLVAKVAEESGALHLALSSDPEIVRGRQQSFNFWTRPEDQARSLVEGLTERAIQRVAVITAADESQIALRKAIDVENNGRIEVLFEKALSPRDTDFRKFFHELARHEAQAIIVLLAPGQCATFAREVKLRALKLQLIGSDVFGDLEEMKRAAGGLSKSLYVSTVGPKPDFIEEYQKRFPNQSLWGAAYGHDVVQTLAKAIQAGGKLDQILTFYRSLDHNGALGSVTASGDQRFNIGIELKDHSSR